jgi:hypothetical protein
MAFQKKVCVKRETKITPAAPVPPCIMCDRLANYKSTGGLSSLAVEMRLVEEWSAHNYKCPRIVENQNKTHTGNGTYAGAWAFTLTKAPTDPYNVGDMICAVRKVLLQKSCPVVKYAWYLEYKSTPEDAYAHPHIHGIYETATGGRIEAKHFKRAWPIWDEKSFLGKGFRGGYHRPIKSEEGYQQYIKKDGGISESGGQI